MELMDCAETYSASLVLKLQVALSIAVTLGGELKLPSNMQNGLYAPNISSFCYEIQAACILTFRLTFRDQKLFDYRGGRAQPQPILSMFVLGTTFNARK
jgi:hypothetical protein